VSAEERPPDFDKPETSQTADLGPSELTDGTIRFACAVYPSFAVAQVNDPGLMGLTRLTIRPRAKGVPINELCAPQGYKGTEKELPAEDYFWGVAGSFVFVVEPDSFGGAQWFRVYDAANGQQLYEAAYTNYLGLTLIRKGTSVGVAYHHHLKVSCQPTLEGARCWKRLFEENKVPASLKLKKPDCKAAFRRERSPMNNNALISVPVRVDDLSKPALTFVSGRATCEPSP
jgi:hypothetical protein